MYKKINKKIEFIKFNGDFKTIKVYAKFDNLNIYVAKRRVSLSKFQNSINLFKLLITNNFYLGKKYDYLNKEPGKEQYFKLLFNVTTQEYKLYDENEKNLEKINLYNIDSISCELVNYIRDMYNLKEISIETANIKNFEFI